VKEADNLETSVPVSTCVEIFELAKLA